MPFGSVYTSLQTGVVDFAENGVNVYDSNKHYEVAPVLSMTEHEANNRELRRTGELERAGLLAWRIVFCVLGAGFVEVVSGCR
jgi:hypothetical protein